MLEPHPTTNGLWVEPGWAAGKPGTFAVVIGVSAYAHLEGGTGPVAPKTYDLGQLSVSALTAYTFFNWLRSRYSYPHSPVVWCQLLLSPQRGEVEVRPELTTNAFSPTLQNCRTALKGWHAAMATLEGVAAGQSRSIFFFSGHGLKIQSDRQILLPCDYLNPEIYGVNNALSTLNLAKGLKSLKVLQHFFFVNACRNDHNNLDEVDEITGDRVLDEPKARYYTKPPCYAPVFYASAAGTQAWQAHDPHAGGSIFGKALLDGLRADPGDTFDFSAGVYKVNVYGLNKFLQLRVAELLQGKKDQYPVLAGNPLDPDSVVTEVPSAFQVSLETEVVLREDEPPAVQVFRADLRPASGAPSDHTRLHEAFASESLTDIWAKTVKLFNLTKGRWVDPGGLVLHRVDRAHDGSSYRVELSITGDRGNHWLEFHQYEESAGPRALVALLLPDNIPPSRRGPDDSTRPRYRLELEWVEFSPGKRFIRRTDVGLAAEQTDPHLTSAAILWDLFSRADIRQALAESEERFLEYTIRSKFEAPLAAIVAGLMLVRAERWNSLHDWFKNVAKCFEYLPDGPVLWNEQLLRKPEVGVGDCYNPVRQLFSLGERGLPVTGEAFNYALKQAEALGVRDDVGEPERVRIVALHARLRRALRFFRSGGLFCSFVGPPDELKPELAHWG